MHVGQYSKSFSYQQDWRYTYDQRLLYASYSGPVDLWYKGSTLAWQLKEYHNTSKTQYDNNSGPQVWVAAGYIRSTAGNNAYNDFTGQHRCLLKNKNYLNFDLEGLICCANNNEYYNINKNKNHIQTSMLDCITIVESLPIVSLSHKKKDKSIFGVISYKEDIRDNKRELIFGKFVSVEEYVKGDDRLHINGLGEGAIWVSDMNGPLESGDYITSSDLRGYGMKQDEDN